MLIDSGKLMENIMNNEEGGFTDHHIQVLQQIIESLEKESKTNNSDPDTYIAIVWHIVDVLSIRPDLTEHQAMEVLGKIEDNHDCSIGITWDTLESHAEELFPKTKTCGNCSNFESYENENEGYGGCDAKHGTVHEDANAGECEDFI